MCAVVAFCYTGPTPLLAKFIRARSSNPVATSTAKEEALGRDPQEKPEDYQHNRMSQITINVEAVRAESLISHSRCSFSLRFCLISMGACWLVASAPPEAEIAVVEH